MQNGLPEFSSAQWEFLALFEALDDEPVPLDVAGTLTPLLPGPFFDLLNRADRLGWIKKIGEDRFSLAPDLPQPVLDRLREINTPERLSSLIDRLEHDDLMNRVSTVAVARMMAESGSGGEAAKLEIRLAKEALENNRHEEALRFTKQAVERLAGVSEGHDGNKALLISSSLQLSHLCFMLGQDLKMLRERLESARTEAEYLGDSRSQALINLHLGRLFYFTGSRTDAQSAFSAGWKGVKELGDADIMTRASEFLGIYFIIQGLCGEAMEHLEKAVMAFESTGGTEVSPLAPIFMGYCATYVSQFHKAIGTLDCCWRLARERSDLALATTYRAAMGAVLAHIRKFREASFHLEGAKEEAVNSNNTLGLYFAGGGLSYLHFLQGNTDRAHQLLIETANQGTSTNLTGHYASPWILEMLFEFERLGYEPVPGYSFREEARIIMQEPDIHLRGVALRLRARQAVEAGEDFSAIQSDLIDSESYLKRSGDVFQLSRTWLEMARLELKRGGRDKARLFARKARQGLSGLAEEAFPDDLRHLLEDEVSPLETQSSDDKFLKRYLDLVDSLFPSRNENEILTRVVRDSNRLFGAERGGLFWFPSSKKKRNPMLRAACNLTQGDVAEEAFQPNLKLIIKSARENRSIVIRSRSPIDPSAGPGNPVRAILCIPIELDDKVMGVIYHDNSYLDDCFDFLDESMMRQLARHASINITRILDYGRAKEKEEFLALERSLQEENLESHGILFESPVMVGLLKQADKVAATEATVLIQGETGVGKELLAQRIHRMSLRSSAPLVAVDLTSIPTTLLESEFFGHEKGAFTGAHRQKHGRIELADKGTLFIDELGEIPESAQTKLLRAVQEKTFVRIGGTRTLTSDFRLVAATQRNLQREVAAGRFREDLYYRLNVVTLSLPPLRERGEDVILLARHFLHEFAREHQRPGIHLTDEDEAALKKYNWPGNVRELKNVMERAVLLSTGDRLELNLQNELISYSNHPFSDTPSLDEVQRRYINHVLEKTGNKISGPEGAAKILGMNRATLYSRMKKLGMR